MSISLNLMGVWGSSSISLGSNKYFNNAHNINFIHPLESM